MGAAETVKIQPLDALIRALQDSQTVVRFDQAPRRPLARSPAPGM